MSLMRARIIALAALLSISASGRLPAAQLCLTPTGLGPVRSLPAMTLGRLAAPALYSPAAPLSAPMLALPAPGLTPIVQAPAVSAAPLVSPAAPAETASAGPQASKEELAFTAKAALDLAVLAEDWGAERGMKASGMTGQDFLAMLDAGMALYAERHEAKAPSPQAYAAARTVQAQVVRMVKAMLKTGEPLNGQIRRILSVWNVFNQAMEEAAHKGTTSAVADEARLFASQVEQSV